MGTHAARPRSRRRLRRVESARLGTPHRKRPPRQAAARSQPPAENRGDGPASNELVYKVVDAADEIAKETGKTVAQIALNWLLQHPTASNVIMGARNKKHLRQNLGAVGWNLTPQQVARLDAASATTVVYPYWHQHQFVDRNPPPIRYGSPTNPATRRDLTAGASRRPAARSASRQSRRSLNA
jgi:hypothetical protein